MLSHVFVLIITAMTSQSQMNQSAADLSTSDPTDYGWESTTLMDCGRVAFYFVNRTSNGTHERFKACLNQTTPISEHEIEPSLPIIILIHGWKTIAETFANSIIKCYPSSFKANIILVDWYDIAMKNYITARYKVGCVGKHVEAMIDRIHTELKIVFKPYLMVNSHGTQVLAPSSCRFFVIIGMGMGMKVPFTSFHCVGHSLGAHICFKAGSGKINHTYGLDPALPLLVPNPIETRKSAQLVCCMHTNAGMMGTTSPLGHANFVINGGTTQPGCGVDFSHLPGYCSHQRSIAVYCEALKKPTAYKATACSNYLSYLLGLCEGNDWAYLSCHNLFHNTTQEKGQRYYYQMDPPQTVSDGES